MSRFPRSPVAPPPLPETSLVARAQAGDMATGEPFSPLSAAPDGPSQDHSAGAATEAILLTSSCLCLEIFDRDLADSPREFPGAAFYPPVALPARWTLA